MKKLEQLTHLFDEARQYFAMTAGSDPAEFYVFCEEGCIHVHLRANPIVTNPLDNDDTRSAHATIVSALMRINVLTVKEVAEYIEEQDTVFYNPETKHFMLPNEGGDEDLETDRGWTIWSTVKRT